jgi:sec-independent protein translocase protein TatA
MGFLREPSHLILVGLIVVILFGSRRLPDVARGLGQSMRIFKAEVKQMQNEDSTPKRPAGQPVPPVEPLEGRVVPPATRVDEPVRETPRNL